MLNLSSEGRRALRARAHSLQPVVSISDKGLSESVVQEIDVSLAGHELIKIRVRCGDRATREQLLATLCEQLQAAPVQHIGKLLVIWRAQPADKVRPARPRPLRSGPRRSKRSFQDAADR